MARNEGFELATLDMIFDNGNRSLWVPDYQRGYSWERKQVEDLIEDLESIISGEGTHRHFTGTIVATQAEEPPKDCLQPCLEIVDGQQRLTTLVILLSLLAAENPNLRSRFVERELEPGKTARLFKLNRDTDLFFRQRILGENSSGTPVLNKSHQNLLEAKDLLSKWLIPLSPPDRTRIREAVLSSLGFLFYCPAHTREIGMMFEVINNRGKALSQLEKVKNYLIYYATRMDFPDLEQVVNEQWGTILSNLMDSGLTSNDDENGFLRNCWLVAMSPNKSESFYVYENMKEDFPAFSGLSNKAEHFAILKQFVEFLRNASRSCLLLKNPLLAEPAERDALQRLSLQNNIASVIPLVLAVFAREGDPVQRNALFSLIERLNFRFYGCPIAKRSDSGQGELFGLAHEFYKRVPNRAPTIDSNELATRLTGFVARNAHDEAFKAALTLDPDEPGDYYSWGSLRYFLANYENHLNGQVGKSVDMARILASEKASAPNDFYHREHLWAAQEYEVVDDREKRHIGKRRLGNFVLLEKGLNISASNNRLEDKIDAFFRFRSDEDIPNTRMLRELNEMFTQAKQAVQVNRGESDSAGAREETYMRFFDLREAKLIDFALKRWEVGYTGRV